MFNAIDHVAIICSDYEKSKYFYTQILGFSVQAEHYRDERNSYKLDLSLSNGDKIELFSFENAPQRVTSPEALGLRHLAFSVPSVEQACIYLMAKDIAVEPVRVDPFTDRLYTFFRDPDGLPLEIYEAQHTNKETK